MSCYRASFSPPNVDVADPTTIFIIIIIFSTNQFRFYISFSFSFSHFLPQPLLSSSFFIYFFLRCISRSLPLTFSPLLYVLPQPKISSSPSLKPKPLLSLPLTLSHSTDGEEKPATYQKIPLAKMNLSSSQPCRPISIFSR